MIYLSPSFEKGEHNSPLAPIEDSLDEALVAPKGIFHDEKFIMMMRAADSDPMYSNPPAPPEPEHEQYADITNQQMKSFSWRNEICRFLNVSLDALDDEVFQAMGKASETLQEAGQIEARYEARQGPPRYEIIHSVQCEKSGTEGILYMDQPWVVETDPNNTHLQGSQPIVDFDLYLERNQEVAFIVYKSYRCCERPHNGCSKSYIERCAKVEVSSLLAAEHISIISPDLRSAMENFTGSAVAGVSHNDFKESKELSYPYVWWYHCRKEDLTTDMDQLSGSRMVNLVREYVHERMEEEWETVEQLLVREQISLQYMDYLFVPGEIAISTEHGRDISKLEGVVIQGWHERSSSMEYSAKVNITSWTFDGTFRKVSKELSIQDVPATLRTEVEEFNITDLPIYPLEYASLEVFNALRKRGRMFWKCRFRNYVALAQETSEEIQDAIGSRFMIDIETYKKLHPDGKGSTQKEPSPDPNDLNSKYMSQDNPDLGDEFFMCLPASIYGFNMDNNGWVNLDVHFLRDAVWNTEAFDVPEETKLLIHLSESGVSEQGSFQPPNIAVNHDDPGSEDLLASNNLEKQGQASDSESTEKTATSAKQLESSIAQDNEDTSNGEVVNTPDTNMPSLDVYLQYLNLGAVQSPVYDSSPKTTEKWFKMLRNTTHEFMYKKGLKSTSPVKIAVLDSGFAYTSPKDKRSLKPYYQRIKKFANFIEGSSDSEAKTDPSGNGTAVAVQILKVSLKAVLYICQVVSPDGTPDKLAVEKAIRKCAAKPDKDSPDGGGWDVDIINMSFGWPYSNDGVREAIDFAHENGVLMFAATSNGFPHEKKDIMLDSISNDGLLDPPNDILYPARSDRVIAVDVADGLGNHAGSAQSLTSQHSRGPIFSAPGLGMTSPNTDRVWSGSAFACPVAAGVAALILEFARQSPLNKSPEVQTYLQEMPAMLSVLRRASSEKNFDEPSFLTPWKLIGKAGEERLITAWFIVDELRKEYGLEVGKELSKYFILE